MKKILFGITSLGLGGAERVLVDIVNKLSNTYSITIFTLYAKGEFEKFLPENVDVISLYDKEYKEFSKLKKIAISLNLLLNRKRIYCKYIKKKNFDTEVAFLEGPITRLFATKNKNVNKIAWVHNDILQVFGNSINSKIKKIYDKKVYDKYSNIVFVSKDNLERFKTVYPSINKNKLKLIYNYIDAQNVMQKANDEISEHFESEYLNFVTVARLVEQKAIDRFLNVHEKLINEGIMHNVYVIGDGPQKEVLEKMIKRSNLESTFKLLGKKENPYPYIKNADVFCLLSLYEGYGMVLEEAKILNKYIVITNTAAREAIQDYKNSTIIENNEDAIYNEIKEIVQNKETYKNSTCTETKYDNSILLEQINELLQ